MGTGIVRCEKQMVILYCDLEWFKWILIYDYLDREVENEFEILMVFQIVKFWKFSFCVEKF